MIKKFTITGKSLLELREEFGIGKNGFYDQDWYLNEPFAKEKPESGIYEIDFDGKFGKMAWDEQEKKIPKGWQRAHEAIIIEAVLTHYKETGERLLEDWYHWGPSLGSYGKRVIVGCFDSGGLYVRGCRPAWDDFGFLRVCLLRKLRDLSVEELKSFEVLKVKSLPDILEVNGERYKKLVEGKPKK